MRTNKFIISLSAPGGCNDTKVSDEKWLRFDCNNPISQISTPASSDIFIAGNSLSLQLIVSRDECDVWWWEWPVFRDIVRLFVPGWYYWDGDCLLSIDTVHCPVTQDGTWSCRPGLWGIVIISVSINWQEKHSKYILTKSNNNHYKFE